MSNVIQFDAASLAGKIDLIQEVQLPYAARVALNNTVFHVQQYLKDWMADGFNQPVPLTVNSARYTKAKLDKNNPNAFVAEVYINDWVAKGNSPSRYLKPQITGGLIYRTRFQKAMQVAPYQNRFPGETGIRSTGQQILAPNRAFVPTNGKAVRRNKYGNMTPGQYTQILSAMNHDGVKMVGNSFYLYYDPIRDAKFASEMNGLERRLDQRGAGIYLVQRQRRGLKTQKVLADVPTPSVKRKFPLDMLTEAKANEIFPREFRNVFAEATKK